MEHPLFLPYHEPDKIWSAFSGITDFESYRKHFVIAGRFHKDVPSDVVSGYVIAEHIMAHAYYHYPALDEALVKLLRVVEMGVKMRCQQLGIGLQKENGHKKVLNALINELSEIEPSKPIKETLNWLRDIRNYLMHPSHTSLLGSIVLNYIRHGVIMLNALFLPEQYFISAKVELERIQDLAQNFKNGLFVLEHIKNRYIVYQIDIVETFYVGNEWQYLIAFQAVPSDFPEMLSKDSYPSPLIYLIKNLQIKEDQINGIITDCEQPFLLTVDDHSKNKATLEEFEVEKLEMNEFQQKNFLMNNTSEIMKLRTRLRYELWGINGEPNFLQ